MRIGSGMAALCAALLLAWPALADEKGEAGDQDVGAVVEEGQLPPAIETPPVEGAPPDEGAAPGEAEEGAESSE
jgi:hypothetical protein